MSAARVATFDPRLDVVLDRDFGVPRELAWAAWTQPEHVAAWFAPVPWTIPRCEIDLTPGGTFLCVMRSPEGVGFRGAWSTALDQLAARLA
jgi:uncharacterized protein YndB with AHSA1/START domain